MPVSGGTGSEKFGGHKSQREFLIAYCRKICFIILFWISITKSEPFAYAEFFHKQILKKKKDHSYRVFKKVNRLAEQFPAAMEYTGTEKPVTVWCSNDYLGMSRHPEVRFLIDCVRKIKN